MRVDEFTWPGYSEYIYQNASLVTALSYATVAFQVSFPFLFCLNRYTRRLVLLAGFSFHLGIGLFMGLITFSAFMTSVELALIADGDYRRVGQWYKHLHRRLTHWASQRRSMWRESPALAPLRVHLFYDGWCPFCRQSIATLQRLDLLMLLQPVSFRDPGVLERFGLEATRAATRLQARAAGATTTVEGIDAFTLVGTRLPILWPIVPVLWVAGRLGIGQRLYDRVAVRRTILPTSCAGHCELQPASERAPQHVSI